MNFLISFCLNNRITVILLTIALAIVSIFVVKNIPVDVFPELKVPRVTIQVSQRILCFLRQLLRIQGRRFIITRRKQEQTQ